MSGIYETEPSQEASQEAITSEGAKAETKATIDGWWVASWPGYSEVVVCTDPSYVPEMVRTLNRLDSHIPIEVVPADRMPQAGEEAICACNGAILRAGVQTIQDWIDRREAKLRIPE